jgi:hypothetical protein
MGWRTGGRCPACGMSPGPARPRPLRPDTWGSRTTATATTLPRRRVQGSATTAALDLTAATDATLSFSQYWEVEFYPWQSVDQMRVQGFDGSWHTVAQWDSTRFPAFDWGQETIDLGAYAGSSIQLRFNFDSVDRYSNAYLGWLIDDVRVTAS